jgi:hypothetical protein
MMGGPWQGSEILTQPAEPQKFAEAVAATVNRLVQGAALMASSQRKCVQKTMNRGALP